MLLWLCPVEGCEFSLKIPEKLEWMDALEYGGRIERHFRSHTIEEIFSAYLKMAPSEHVVEK